MTMRALGKRGQVNWYEETQKWGDHGQFVRKRNGHPTKEFCRSHLMKV